MALLVSFAASAPAQWEVGVAVGYGIYRNASVYAPAGKAAAGFRNRFTVGAVIGEDLYNRVGGEFRYTYQDGDPFVAAAGVKTNVQGQSHAFHYDFLFHVRERGARIRPYAIAGVGAKLFVVSGPASPVQPLENIVRLTTESDFKPLVTGGGGVRMMLGKHVVLRLDFRDYITPFPKKVIAPAPLGTARGIYHMFTPMVGLSWIY